jgi:hypothetical protein
MNNPQNTDAIFINLKVIAQLQPYQRLNTQNELLYVESGGVLSWDRMRRLVYGDSRDHTLTRINDLVVACSQYCQLNKGDAGNVHRMHRHLQDTRYGIQNLKTTYQQDVTTTSYLDNILDKIHGIVAPEDGAAAAVNEAVEKNDDEEDGRRYADAFGAVSGATVAVVDGADDDSDGHVGGDVSM